MKCELCGEKAVVECIENGDVYCGNCSVLMNVDNMGVEWNDYHFREVRL